MRGNGGRGVLAFAPVWAAAIVLFSGAPVARCQEQATAPVAGAAASTSSESDIQALGDTVRALEEQVKALNSQLGEMRTEEQSSRDQIRELRKELDVAKGGAAPHPTDAGGAYYPPLPSQPVQTPGAGATAGSQAAAGGEQPPREGSIEDRLAKVEDDVALANDKINDQAQTKVESGSKYRVRLSGIVLLNLFGERGAVDSLDMPEIATAPSTLDSAGAFGGTLRQSQIGIEAFGPDVAGARTSANIKFDFAGGFPDEQNGATMGMMRLRTGTIRFDWENTSLIAGQDYLFFAPIAPSSLASLAQPALSYAGNLWGWTPQVRIEHRVDLSKTSKLIVEAGILDSLSGDVPRDQSDRYPSWGEQSGQPAYAGRIAWTRRTFGQDLTIGTGGFYARQSWGFGRDVNAWASTIDVTVPLGNWLAFSGEFYRGRALGGFGGGLGQTILLSGSFITPSTTVAGLDSMGGWGQLKFKIRPTFEINAALGDDSPFAGEIRRFPASPSYYGPSLARNLSPLVNFIYQPKSDILFSTEYRRLTTSPLDAASNTANLLDLSLGYLF